METAPAIAGVLVRADAWACITGREPEVSQISIRNSNVETFAFVRSSSAGSISDQGIGVIADGIPIYSSLQTRRRSAKATCAASSFSDAYAPG